MADAGDGLLQIVWSALTSRNIMDVYVTLGVSVFDGLTKQFNYNQ